MKKKDPLIMTILCLVGIGYVILISFEIAGRLGFYQ